MSGSLAPVSIKDLRCLFGETLLKAGARTEKLEKRFPLCAFGDGAVVPFVRESISRSGWFRFDAYVGVILDEALSAEFGASRLSCNTTNFPADRGLRPMPFAEDALVCLPAWLDTLQTLVARLPRDEAGLRDCLARDDIAGLPARYFLPFRLIE